MNTLTGVRVQRAIMKRSCGLYLSLAIVVWGAVAGRAANYEALNEVLKLKNGGMDQQTILTFVRSRNLNYDLTADDLLALQKQGFSPDVLSAMIASGRPGPTASSPTPLSPPPVVAIAPPATAAPVAPVSADAAYFYQELKPYGSWILTEEGQWCWQPTVAVTTREWRPYWDRGHWVYSENGWYWSSDYSWGWAPFHYGRWRLHPHHGWIWQPDRVWGPAWVTWREGGDYCGWAPLPPGAVYDVGAGAFFWRGKRVEAGFDFGLDWNHFSFTLVKEMGDPLHVHFKRPEEIRAVFQKTAIVNRYTVVSRPGENHPHVVNHGIDPEIVRSRRGGRAVEVVHIEDMKTPPKGRGRERVDKDHHTIEVYRPRIEDHPGRH